MNVETFGGFFKRCRVIREYTQRELVHMLRTSPYYISLIENGKKINPDVKIFGKLYEALNLSKDELELHLHAKENNCVCCDLTDFIMQNEDIIEQLRSARDKPNARPNLSGFIKINNGFCRYLFLCNCLLTSKLLLFKMI